MALLRLSAELPGVHVVALTVDHGLREGSRAEAEQVARWCAGLSVPHHILTWDGEKPASGIQAKARAARYDLMSAWCRSNGISVLLTAHTLNDQAETVLMRKQRTTSAASLAGIWPETEWNGVRVVRPLLGVTRCTLRAMLKRVGQGWLEDPSNDNDRFERVRIRRSLRNCNIASLGQEAAAAQARALAHQQGARAWLLEHATVHPLGFFTFPRLALNGVEPDMAILILSRLISVAGGGRPERAEVARVLEAIGAKSSFRRSLGGALMAARKREVLIVREPGRIPAAPVPVPDSGLLWDGRFALQAPPGFHVRPAKNHRQGAAGDLPHDVVQGLPVLENAAGRLVFPHFDADPAFRVQLGERFCL